MRKTVYLAGPITGLTFEEAKGWRDDVTQQLGDTWHCLSPLRGKEHCDLGSEPLPSNFDGGGDAVRRDLHDIRRSQAVLLNLLDTPIPSIGTMCELGYAKGYAAPELFCATVITVLSPTYQERGRSGGHIDPFVARHFPNPHEHVFVRELSDIVVSTLHEAVTILKEIA